MITEAEVRKVYETAPKHLKEYIDSDGLFNAFHEIRRTHKLHIDQAGNLAMAIDAVVLGMKRFDELPMLLREGLAGVDDATREKVVKDVNDKVFVPLREYTKKRAEETQKTTAPKPVPTSPPQSAPPPSVRNIELKLTKEPTPAVAPVTAEPAQQTQSIVEQKMPPAPPPAQAPPVEPAAQREAPRYHGTDPYRETIE